ncbi:MAG: hypothetical protein ACRDTT_12390, partial [Pseudonocardiaceae bacterium]
MSLAGVFIRSAHKGYKAREREQARAAAAAQRKAARAQANQHIREAREYLAHMKKHGTHEDIQAAQNLLNEWLQY